MRTLTTATVLLLALAAGACSRDDILDFNTPDVIDPGALDNPLGVQALYAGAVSELAFQMDNAFGLALVSALFTDEAMHASTPPAVREWDLRNVLTTNTTTPALFLGGRRESYNRLEASVRLSRYGTDCYAYAMLAAGHIDLVVECGLKPYDVGGLIPVIEQAGGIITAWDGGPAEMGGEIIAAGSRKVYDEAMALLKA